MSTHKYIQQYLVKKSQMKTSMGYQNTNTKIVRNTYMHAYIIHPHIK